MRVGLLIALLLVAAPLWATPSESDYRAHLVRFEGLRLSPYSLQGNVHVGIGHSLTAHHERAKGRYTSAEVARMFRADLQQAIATARAGVHGFDTLPDQVQVITVGLAFNVGPTGFTRFTEFRRALGSRDYQRAARELAHSHWARQVGAARAGYCVGVLLEAGGGH